MKNLKNKNKLSLSNSAYTLAEVVITMLIIAVVAGASIKITRTKLDNIITYNYYAAYQTVKIVTDELLESYSPKKDNYKISFWDKVRFAFKTPIFIPKSYAVPVEEPDTYYTCATEFYTEVGGSGSSFGLGIKAKESLNYSDLDCTNAPRWYSGFSEGTNGYKKCPGKYKFEQKHDSDLNYWDFSLVRDTYVTDSPDYTDSCTRSCGSNNTNNCGSFMNNFRQNRFHCNCVGGEYLGYIVSKEDGLHHGSEDYLNSWPICRCDKKDSSGTSDCTPKDCDEGFIFNPDKCECIPSPMTIPKQNFCQEFEARVNSKGSLLSSVDKITEYCKGDSISSIETNFLDKKPDIILRNGMRIYNISQDYVEIPALVGNTEGSKFTRSSDNKEIDVNKYGYIMYVDIDGSSSEGILWYDVYPFYITLSGNVIPAYNIYDVGASGGDSRLHLTVSIKNILAQGPDSWLYKSVTFREGACRAGFIGENSVYCSKNGFAITKDSRCSQDSADCKIKVIRPMIFLGHS